MQRNLRVGRGSIAIVPSWWAATLGNVDAKADSSVLILPDDKYTPEQLIEMLRSKSNEKTET